MTMEEMFEMVEDFFETYRIEEVDNIVIDGRISVADAYLYSIKSDTVDFLCDSVSHRIEEGEVFMPREYGHMRTFIDDFIGAVVDADGIAFNWSALNEEFYWQERNIFKAAESNTKECNEGLMRF